MTGLECFLRIRTFVRTECRKISENICFDAVPRNMRTREALFDCTKLILQRRIFRPMDTNSIFTQRFPKIIRHFQQQQPVGDDKNPRMRIRFTRNTYKIVHLRVQQRFAAHQTDGANGKLPRKFTNIFDILLQIREGRFGYQR